MARIKSLKNPEKIPTEMQEIFNEIAAYMDKFCKEYLNDEYDFLLRKMAATLCRKRPSPILNRNLRTWMAGMVHAIGMVNFLFDKSQRPYMSSGDISAHFGLSQSTISSKSKQIRELLKITQFDANWMLPSKIEDNSLVWMISVNGFIVDARHLTIELQEIAHKKGLIPYIPALKKEGKRSLISPKGDERV